MTSPGFRITIRVVLSSFLAFPLAFVAVGLSDNAGMPELIRTIISPGMRPAMWLSSGPFLPAHEYRKIFGSLSRFLGLLLFFNTIYYAILIYAVTAIVTSRKK
jgi:hypothetical protein